MTQHLPLIVDLDETLLLTDTLAEGLVGLVLHRPTALPGAVASLIRGGRPALKRFVSAKADLDLEGLPVREDLLSYLKSEKATGRTIVLVTAADQSVADAVAAHFDLFDAAHGSSGSTNLKGDEKRAYIRQLFPDGYVYAGDSRADLKVWRDADGIIFAGPSAHTRKVADGLGKPVEADFPNSGGGLKSWRKALRLHQWAKNLLLFAPLGLSGRFLEPEAILLAVAGFLLLGVVASGTYLLNDLLDLSADRRHKTKRSRPLASGELSVVHGLLAAPFLILTGLVVGWLIAPWLAVGLACYLVITIAYSFGLKRVPMLDVFVLATLFTTRIAIGALAIGAHVSEWLMTFSMLFFFSMSLAKRHVEVVEAPAGLRIRGRGYFPEDAPLTLSLGLSSAASAVVIMILYLAEDAFPSGIYSQPAALWAAPPLIALWMMRIWLLAHRGQLDDDPVAFAVKDRWSLLLGAALLTAFVIATLA
ncbi:UbiA family prenyltransferase [uncultured Maricaulis sp.]|uniref:UbiA family prenyltransferase n=1 Tax=uncultured Maricaulis sp. TaxID=174710 RepID=UPI0030D95923|tara:strand:- start:2901 stop:4328 length:1428 start_codon:yes stop_codon:yes gene_type:complete